MREKLKYLLLAAAIVVLGCVWVVFELRPDPLVDGHPTAYWLERLSAGGNGLLPDKNPLIQAGPEIIPALTNAIGQSYSGHPFLHRLRQYVPAFINRYLPRAKTPGWEIRQVAALRVGLMGPAASNAVPVLVDLLEKPPGYVGDKTRVMQALGYIGPPARAAAPVLARNLGDSSEYIRMNAVQALLQIGTVPPTAIPTLKSNLNNTGYVAAGMAVALLIAEKTPESLSRVATMLAAAYPWQTPAHAAADLGYLPELPAELKPQLTRLLDSPERGVRQGAAIALARPHAENLDRIIPLLIEGLRSGPFQARCATALGRIGPEAASARQDLQQAQGYVLGIAARDALAKIDAAPNAPAGAAAAKGTEANSAKDPTPATGH